eukprot:2167596-Prymnesium_polylepis.1
MRTNPTSAAVSQGSGAPPLARSRSGRAANRPGMGVDGRWRARECVPQGMPATTKRTAPDRAMRRNQS